MKYPNPNQSRAGIQLPARRRFIQTAFGATVALDLKAGGVGYYAKSSFIHIDTGRVRHW
jgi:hypothetical protein